jgi:hypothetical protein
MFNERKAAVCQGIWTNVFNRNNLHCESYQVHTTASLQADRLTVVLSMVSFTIMSTLRALLSPVAEHQIDKIVCTHNKGRIKQHLVKWKGYDHTFIPWVNTMIFHASLTLHFKKKSSNSFQLIKYHGSYVIHDITAVVVISGLYTGKVSEYRGDMVQAHFSVDCC